MRKVTEILGLIVALAAGPASAQELFEVPVELELSALAVVLELDNASVEIVLDPESAPVLRARKAAQSDPAAAIAVDSEAGAVIVRRTGNDADSAPRLRLELVLDFERWLRVTGSQLDVVVEAKPDEKGEDEKDADSQEEAAERKDQEESESGEGGDRDGETPDPPDSPVAPKDEPKLSLEVAGSSIDLRGVRGAQITADNSYVHAGGTRGGLTLTLEGGTVEVKGHQGALILTSRDSEVALADLLGQVECAVTGGSLLLQSGVGQLQGRLVDALLRIDDWRGTVLVEGSGATVEAHALLGVRMEIKGEGHAIAIDELQGPLLAELGGGSLTATKLVGQAQITAGGGAEIAIDGIQGQAMLTLEQSSARLADVAGQVIAGVEGGRLEVDGARGLELVAAGAEIVVRRLRRLLKAEATDSQLDLDFSELNHDPTLTLQGSSEARVRMKTPCSVKLGEVQLLGGGVDVTGCALHSQTLRRARQERVGVDGNRRLTLSVNLGQASTLKVEGAP